MPDPQPNRRKWIVRGAKVVLLALVGWGIARAMGQAWQDLGHHHFQTRWGWLVASGALYLLGQFPSGLFYHRILWSLGQRPRLRDSLRAYYIGHVGKYVPGKAMVVVLRASLVRGPQVNGAIAAIAVFYETLTSMAAGALVAALCIAGWLRGPWYLVLISFGLMMVAALPTIPAVFLRLVRKVGKRWADPVTLASLDRLEPGVVLWGWILICLGWLLQGLGLWAVLRGFDDQPTPLSLFPELTASVSLATVAGFVAMIPAGAGVRELVLEELLYPAVGQTPALISALLLRLVTLVAELLISSILYLWHPARTPDQASPPATRSDPLAVSSDES